MTECDACGFEQKTLFGNKHQVEGGITIPFRALGHYGGFTDNEPWEEIEDPEVWVLCHDCVLHFLRAFPRLAATLVPGLHSCEDSVPCCAWAWKPHPSGSGVLVGKKDETGVLSWAEGN
jgi:hypothetical protein